MRIAYFRLFSEGLGKVNKRIKFDRLLAMSKIFFNSCSFSPVCMTYNFWVFNGCCSDSFASVFSFSVSGDKAGNWITVLLVSASPVSGQFLRTWNQFFGHSEATRFLPKAFLGDKNPPLRGYLVCPKCDRAITGSASKGRHNYYYCYHCISSCGLLYRADLANDLFEKELKKIVPHPAIVDLSKVIILKAFQDQFKQRRVDQEHLLR